VPFPIREFRVFMNIYKSMLINGLRWHGICVQKVSTEAAWGSREPVENITWTTSEHGSSTLGSEPNCTI
jgi:hypothetical protein